MKQASPPIHAGYEAALGAAVHQFAAYEWSVIQLIAQFRRGFLAKYSRGMALPSGAVLQGLRGIASDPATPLEQRTSLQRCCATYAGLIDLRDALLHPHLPAAAEREVSGDRDVASSPLATEVSWPREVVDTALARFNQATQDANDLLIAVRQSRTAAAARSTGLAGDHSPPTVQEAPTGKRRRTRRLALAGHEPVVFELRAPSDIRRLTRFLLTHWPLPRIKVSTDVFHPPLGSQAQARFNHLQEANDSLTGALIASALTLQAALVLMLMYVSRSWLDLTMASAATLAAALIGKGFTVLVARFRILLLLSTLKRSLPSNA